MDMSKYKSMFISETQEHLQAMNQGLLTLEQNPAAQDAITEVFRNTHSIKGMAASMGYEPIRDLAHALEDLIDDVREGRRQPEPEVMDLLFQGLDILEKLLQDVNEDREFNPAGQTLAARIRAFRGETISPPGEIISLLPTVPPASPQTLPAAPSISPSRRSRFIASEAEIDFDFEARPVLPRPSPGVPENLELPASVPEPSPGPARVSPPLSRPRPEIKTSSEEDFVFETPAPKPPRAGPQAPPTHLSAPLSSPLDPERPSGPKEEAERSALSPVEPTAALPVETEAEKEARPALQTGERLTVRVVFSAQTSSPGVRGLILFKRLGEVGEVLDSRPSIEEVKSGHFLADPKGLAVEIELWLEGEKEEVERVINTMADLVEYSFRRGDLEAGLPERGEEKLAESVAPAETAPPEGGVDLFVQAPALPQTVRVKTSALDQFINSLGEMMLVKNELREVAKRHPIRALEEGLDRLESLIRDFHGQVMAVRMMPLESVIQRLPRVVRDLARQEGKKVRCELKGQDIELDRAILEQLSDPFIHLLRNAVNHGIEEPEERKRRGKPEEGLIGIEAYRKRDLVAIEVSDDGRGMDYHHLVETAVAKGLISPEEAEQMSPDAAYNLIFRPGFSTAKTVGMVSGRGVGMDVVKSVIENLGGYVTLESQLGRGTTFTLHLPRTIAIIHVLLVRLASEIFAVPLAKLLKTVEIPSHQLRRSQGQTFYLERQELIPMKFLHRLLELPEPSFGPRELIPALIVEVQNRKTALVVSELVGQEEAFIRPLASPLSRITGLSGVTVLGDGRLVFVLDTMSLL